MVLVHLHVHGTCPCSCFMSMLQVHVQAAHYRCVRVYEGMFACVFMCVSVSVCINAGMLNCSASDQSGTGLKKITMPGLVRYRTKPRQFGIILVRYRTGIINAGMPMPALVSSMPMPSYAYIHSAAH
jgi:hypothetical protein